LISNKNLLLPNYYVQLSINCIISITEKFIPPRTLDSRTIKCVPHVQEFWSSKSRYEVKSYIVQRCKQFVTASTSMLVYLYSVYIVALWRGDGHCKLVTCFNV